MDAPRLEIAGPRVVAPLFKGALYGLRLFHADEYIHCLTPFASCDSIP